MSVDAVVVGQLARDLVLRVGRAPAGGESASVRFRREMLGGKGANQAVALRQLGRHAGVIGVLGGDSVADTLLARLDRDGIDSSFVARAPEAGTALIVNLVDDQGQWRYLEHIPQDTLVGTNYVFAASRMIEDAGTVLVQLQQPSGTAGVAARMAHAAGARVVLDGAPADDAERGTLLAKADVLRADAREAEYLAGRRLHTVADAVTAGTRLLEHGPALVVLELSGQGNLFLDANGYEFLPLLDVETVDTTGAGDALLATLISALDAGEHIRTASRLAVAAAALTTGHAGGRPELTWQKIRDRAAEPH